MKKIFLLLILSTQSFAYELISFNQAPQLEPEQLIQKTGIDRSQLTDYFCDNPMRKKLFTKSLIINPAGDSLKIISSEGKEYVYGAGRIRSKDSFVNTTIKTLEKLEEISLFRELLENMQYSPYPFFIKKGGNRYSPNHLKDRSYFQGNNAGFISMMDDRRPIVDRFPFNRIGYGGVIYWNPATEAEFIEVDYIKRKVDVSLILAHEMYHGYDGMRGLLDRRFVKSETHEFQPVAEYRAVYYENLLRSELGYKYRRYYSEPSANQKNQDMLDQNDSPVFISSPCIDWL